MVPPDQKVNEADKLTHRYQKTKIDCLRFIMCPLLTLVFRGFFFVAAMNSTNETNKAGGMCH